jgi:hypothetical protein
MSKLRSLVATLIVAGGCLLLAPSESIAQKRQRDRITREEILNAPHRDLDLFQVIRGLRPHFLEPPPGVRSLGGAYGPTAVAVYVDGVRETGIDALRTITASRVDEVRYLDPTRSENEFGPRASGGAVTVRLYKGAKAAPPARDSTQSPPR